MDYPFQSKYKIVSAPTEDLVGVEDALKQCRLTEADGQNEYLMTLVDTAESMIEGHCGIGIAPQVWETTFNGFPYRKTKHFTLPGHPITGIKSVKYYDTSNTLQDVANTDYVVRSENKIFFDFETPVNDISETSDSVIVQYDVGYTNATLPRDLKHAILMLTSRLYDNRNDFVPSNIKEIGDLGILYILSRYEQDVINS